MTPPATSEEFPGADKLRSACRDAIATPNYPAIEFLAYCYCALHDEPHAKATAAKISAESRQKIAGPCKQLFHIDIQ
jgi:hypothetical protein